MPEYDSLYLAKQLAGVHHGPTRTVTQLRTPAQTHNTSISVSDTLPATSTGVTVLPDTLELAALADDVTVIVVPGAQLRYALAVLSELFDVRPRVSGVAASAVVHEDAVLGKGVHLAAGVVVAAGAVIGAGTRVGANTVIGAGCHVGERCVLHSNVTLYDGVMLGNRVMVHAGAVLGADGFGYAIGPAGAKKIHHLGGVRVADDVEIGANTCVDRGTLEDTVIGARTKLDNLVQIGHNVQIGTDCVIAGNTGIAGSTKLGNRVSLGGAVTIIDHCTLGDGVSVGMNAYVDKDIPANEAWVGAPAKPYKQYVRQRYLLSKLESIWQRVKALS